MDDICDSVHTLTEAKQLMSDVDGVLAEGGFQVKGWLSNRDVEKGHSGEEEVKMKFLETTNEEKVLGTVWNNEKDEISFKVTMEKCPAEDSTDEMNRKLTKRQILSRISRIFDPIGFAAAFLVRAKVAMQQLWQQGLDWDQELPIHEQNKWRQLFREMEHLNDVSFPRCLIL